MIATVVVGLPNVLYQATHGPHRVVRRVRLPGCAPGQIGAPGESEVQSGASPAAIEVLAQPHALGGAHLLLAVKVRCVTPLGVETASMS
jgi:hypothetical protein